MLRGELVVILNGGTYRNEISKALEIEARESGLVVVFGASDDLMEFRGAIDDEVGCFDGGTAYITNKGLLTNRCRDDGCPYFIDEGLRAMKIHAIWGKNGYSWIYKTDINHETFDIMDGGEKYCRGIVFHLPIMAISK